MRADQAESVPSQAAPACPEYVTSTSPRPITRTDTLPWRVGVIQTVTRQRRGFFAAVLAFPGFSRGLDTRHEREVKLAWVVSLSSGLLPGLRGGLRRRLRGDLDGAGLERGAGLQDLAHGVDEAVAECAPASPPTPSGSPPGPSLSAMSAVQRPAMKRVGRLLRHGSPPANADGSIPDGEAGCSTGDETREDERRRRACRAGSAEPLRHLQAAGTSPAQAVSATVMT